MINIVKVEDDGWLLQVILGKLDAADDLHMAWTARDREEEVLRIRRIAIAKLKEGRRAPPELIHMDLGIPALDGTAATCRLKAAHP